MNDIISQSMESIGGTLQRITLKYNLFPTLQTTRNVKYKYKVIVVVSVCHSGKRIYLAERIN